VDKPTAAPNPQALAASDAGKLRRLQLPATPPPAGNFDKKWLANVSFPTVLRSALYAAAVEAATTRRKEHEP
jgi:hypothetical protein